MIVFLLLFVGLPIAMTLVFGDKDRTIAYWMPFTMLILFVIWTVISLPLSLMGTKFHVPLYIFIGVLVVFVCFVIFMLIKRRKEVKKKIKKYFSGDFKKHFTNVFFIVMLLLVLYQVGRATFFAPEIYGDNKTYVALANDILENDEFYVIDDTTGAVLPGTVSLSTKYRLSGWYSFEAALSAMFQKSPLVVAYTILPGYLIILSYLVWWVISRKFFCNNIDKASLFIIFLSWLNEFMNSGVTDIMLVWPTYGKNLPPTIVMPLIVFEWMHLEDNNKDRWIIAELLLLMCAGCSASNMGFLLLPIEVVLLTITEFIVRRKIKIKMIIRAVVLNIPVAIFAVLYILNK